MRNLEVIDNIGYLTVVDNLNDFLLLIQKIKDEDGKTEETYITSIEIDNVNFSTFEGINCVFENCIFNKVMFHKSYFKNCYFKNCDFSNCDFSNSTFYDCIFHNFKGVGTDFSDCVFKNLQVKDSLLRYAVFTFSLFNVCNIERSDLSEAFLDNCKFKKMIFDNDDLIKVNFYKSPLKGIDFRTCQIGGIILSTEANELKGAIVELLQAAELAKMLGIIIK